MKISRLGILYRIYYAMRKNGNGDIKAQMQNNALNILSIMLAR